MTIRWKRLLIQAFLWLSAEIILTSIGFDDLADYGEYHFTPKQVTIAQIIYGLTIS
jgi:hypothetical protein